MNPPVAVVQPAIENVPPGTPPVPIVKTSPTLPPYTPANIDAAYGINTLAALNLNGAGQTVAIVEAFNVLQEFSIYQKTGQYSGISGSLQQDLNQFDQTENLPSITLNATLKGDPWVEDPNNPMTPPNAPPLTLTSVNGANVYEAAWEREAAMDVEWVHAIAPKANIDLIEARSFSPSDMLAAVNLARNAPGVSVVSMSWSFDEADWIKQGGPAETTADSYFTTPAGHVPVTFVAAAGDNGGKDASSLSGAAYPSSSPNVLSVGGTNLQMTKGAYSSETAWSLGPAGTWTATEGSGGGVSKYETQPSYMTPFNSSTMRTTPDVAFDADLATPVYTYLSEDGGWETGAGTSFGTQAWAGIIALADQGRANAQKPDLKSIDKDIYSLSSNDFHDITSGSNGYNATAGYDLVTGRGTPKANLLVEDLIAINETIPNATLYTTSTGTAASAKTASTSNTAMLSPADPMAAPKVSTGVIDVQISAHPVVSTEPIKPAGPPNYPLSLADLLERTETDSDADRLIDSLFTANDFSYLGWPSRGLHR
ncbi:MAG TPA: S53 family peptidase [Pirellulales bacterium]|nr:S53 family peptidase [Pirellulales bacterium]